MNPNNNLKSPYPYFGGKSKIAPTVWCALGDVKNYVEPFFGSGACLLARPNFDPENTGTETINDADGFIANFWRAISEAPKEVARYATWPVSEIDIHARHGWLVSRRNRLQWSLEDPDFFDPKIAGWWVWGISSWIGGGWCSGKGPWRHDGAHLHDARQRPHLGDAGHGINRKRLHLGNAGQGINRQRPHLGDAGNDLEEYFKALSSRLRRVRVCCGDWLRVMGPSVTITHGLTGIFLDPPYQENTGRSMGLYAVDSSSVAADVHAWAIEHGDDKNLRIVVCGYEGEADYPESWRCIQWNPGQGYGAQKKTRTNNHLKERLWLSPHCMDISSNATNNINNQKTLGF